VGPDGVLHLESRAAALRQLTTMSARAAPAALAPLAAALWTPLGPSNLSGRVTDVAVSAGSDRTALAATASGGAWKTTDAGATWTPVFDAYGCLAIGAVAGDPTNPNTFYIGTGEANPGGGSLAYDGNGVWKSVDGGASWSHLNLPTSGSIGHIAIDPQRPTRVFVAAMGPHARWRRDLDARARLDRLHRLHRRRDRSVESRSCLCRTVGAHAPGKRA
jgi:hypothetical protein